MFAIRRRLCAGGSFSILGEPSLGNFGFLANGTATMSRHVERSLEEVQAKLPEIVNGLRKGDKVILMERECPVPRLLRPLPTKRRPRTTGSARGRPTIMTGDHEHLTDFGNYMS